MPVGVCPEQWILEHPQTMIDLQAGLCGGWNTDSFLAPTFTAKTGILKLEKKASTVVSEIDKLLSAKYKSES